MLYYIICLGKIVFEYVKIRRKYAEKNSLSNWRGHCIGDYKYNTRLCALSTINCTISYKNGVNPKTFRLFIYST